MRQYKEYDNRERRTAMKQKRVRKVFERRNNLTSEAEYNWIRYMTWDYRILDGKQRTASIKLLRG